MRPDVINSMITAKYLGYLSCKAFLAKIFCVHDSRRDGLARSSREFQAESVR